MHFAHSYPTPVRLLKLGMIGALALLAGCSSLATSHAPSIPQGPAGDAFYAPPTPLPAGQHGDLIWARQLSNDAALPDAAANWLVLYRSTDIQGKPVAVSGTVAIPKGTPPKGGWPVISWTHGTTGIADICAPSRDDSNYPARGYVNLMNDTLDQWLQRGYAIVKTDYQGLGTPGVHPYLVGESEARGAVDIVLAARQLDPDLSRNWLVMGHSQGGQAAVYTAYLGPIYGQSLNLTGAIAISPASHMSQQFRYAEKHLDLPTSAYGTMVMYSTAALAPGVDLAKIYNEQGMKWNDQVPHRCVGDLRNNLKLKDVFKPDANFSALNSALASFADTENVLPSVPLLVLQADNDEAVYKQLTDMMVNRFKVLGLDVDYRTYHIADKGSIATNHQATVPFSRQDAMSWAEQRLPSGR